MIPKTEISSSPPPYNLSPPNLDLNTTPYSEISSGSRPRLSMEIGSGDKWVRGIYTGPLNCS